MKELIIKIKDEKIEKEVRKLLKEKFGESIEVEEKSQKKWASKEEFVKEFLMDKIQIDTTNYKFNRDELHER